MPGITETASKNKRGRPCKTDPALISGLRGIFTELTTHRALQDKTFQIRAQRLLKEDKAFRWIIDCEEAAKGGKSGYRQTILAALGRIEDDESLLSAARWVCESKPTSKRAVSSLRQWRLGGTRAGSCLALTSILCRAIDDYVANHPATTKEQIIGAMENARDAVEEK